VRAVSFKPQRRPHDGEGEAPAEPIAHHFDQRSQPATCNLQLVVTPSRLLIHVHQRSAHHSGWAVLVAVQAAQASVECSPLNAFVISWASFVKSAVWMRLPLTTDYSDSTDEAQVGIDVIENDH